MLEHSSPHQINKLSARIVGCNLRGDREVNDFYATSRPVIEALLKVEKFEGNIWEPCCGEGHISKVLIEHGYNVKSSDLIDRDYGTPHIDFLSEASECDNIITNPPYKNALDFAEKAVELACGKTALLLKLNFLEGIKRKSFFEVRPPAWVYVFSQRQSLMKNGKPYKGGMMALAWFVWDSAQRQTRVGWI